MHVTNACTSAIANGDDDVVVTAGTEPGPSDETKLIVHSSDVEVVNVRPSAPIADEFRYVYEHSPGRSATYGAAAPSGEHDTGTPPGSPGTNVTNDGVAVTVTHADPKTFVAEAVADTGANPSNRKSIGAFTNHHLCTGSKCSTRNGGVTSLRFTSSTTSGANIFAVNCGTHSQSIFRQPSRTLPVATKK